MLSETGIPGTDDWWLVRLCNKLGEGLPRMGRLQSYRDGDALLPDNALDAGTRESYRRFLRRARLHIVETLRDARTDRQGVVGFRTGAAGDDNGDIEAWENWTRNRMGIQSRQFFNDTADFGRAYILQIPSPTGMMWTIRNEWTTISEQDSVRPWLTTAGISVGFDAIAGAEIVTLFRPGYYRIAWRRTSIPTLPQDGTPWASGSDWTWIGDAVLTPWTPDALLVQNRTTDGYGIYEKHLDTVDRINEITVNAISLIVMQSFRQRGVKGNLPTTYPEGHPNAGQEIDYDEMFKAGPAALWMLPNDTEIWESASTDVTPIYNARKEEVKTLSSLTRTPQDMFDGESQNQSALGAQTSREPLFYAVKAMNEQLDIALGQAQANDFAFRGDEVRADASKIETIFQKIIPATMSEKAEAAAKYKNGGATQRYIDTEVFEMSPQEQRRAAGDRVDEAFTAALATPVATPARVTTGAQDGD